jgi:hypothetical protein
MRGHQAIEVVAYLDMVALNDLMQRVEPAS